MTREQIGSSPKKVRGRSPKSLELIDAMFWIAKETKPVSVRGVGYKLFTAGLIPSMSRKDMKPVYRLAKEAREEGIIPWHWIVDEAREFERTPSWNDPEAFALAAGRQYRLDFWEQQPVRCEVWSEKGTLRGVLAPILHKYGVGFRVMHGFCSATIAYDIAQDDDGRTLNALYIGDWDPSGLWMSEHDLPDRFERYDGDHVEINRIALTRDQVPRLPSFPAADKRKDTRYKWFVHNFGDRCWEIDALDPNLLRARVENEIKVLIDFEAWERCERVSTAQQDSLRQVLANWADCASDQ